jgi:hypothetical protein
MTTVPACPREGCENTLLADQIVCVGDFAALAGHCRGKKRLGEPAAAAIQSAGRGRAYRCELCRQYHNGARLTDRMTVLIAIRATVRALREDPRVGWRGILALADAWSPDGENVNRSRWSEGLDQREAHALP